MLLLFLIKNTVGRVEDDDDRLSRTFTFITHRAACVRQPVHFYMSTVCERRNTATTQCKLRIKRVNSVHMAAAPEESRTNVTNEPRQNTGASNER